MTDAIRRLAIGDSARVYRVDRIGTVFAGDRSIPAGGIRARVDPVTGFLHVPRSHMARTGPLTYGDGERTWVEYRGDSALFSARALESFSSLIFTNEHPPVLVTKDNVSEYQAGHGGKADRNGIYLDTSEIVITDADAIARAHAEGGWELSIGFLADVVRADGVSPDGTTYQFRQENLEGNHLAGTDVGRAGPECRLAMDSATTVAALVGIEDASPGQPAITHPQTEAPKADGETMSEEQKKKDAEAKAKEQAEAKAKADAAEAAKKKAEPKAPAPVPEIKVDHAAMVRERVAIVDRSKSILGDVDHNADNQTLMLAVVAKVDGDDSLKDAAGWSEDYIRARFDAALVAHDKAQRVDTARQIAGIVDGPFRVDNKTGQDAIDLDDILNSHQRYLADAHKEPTANAGKDAS